MRVWQLVPLVSLGALVVLGLRAWLGDDDVPFDVEVELAPDVIPPLPEVERARASGVVVDAEGHPVAGALLALVAAGRTHWAHANADGAFVLEDLAPGEHDVHVVARGYVPAVTRARVPSDAIRCTLGERVDEPPSIEGGLASDLLGRVESGASDTSFHAYTVALFPLTPPTELGGRVPRWQRLRQDGTFRVTELAHGSYRAMLLPPWSGDSTWPDLLAPLDESRVHVFEHPGETVAELVLRPQSGAIRGRVTHGGRAGAQVRPVVGATILATPEPDADSARILGPVTTDVEGAFRLDDVPAGTYRVRALAGELVHEQVVRVEPLAAADASFDSFQ